MGHYICSCLVLLPKRQLPTVVMWYTVRLVADSLLNLFKDIFPEYIVDKDSQHFLLFLITKLKILPRLHKRLKRRSNGNITCFTSLSILQNNYVVVTMLWQYTPVFKRLGIHCWYNVNYKSLISFLSYFVHKWSFKGFSITIWSDWAKERCRKAVIERTIFHHCVDIFLQVPFSHEKPL